MEKQKELEEKVRKINDLKKKIEKKEKKLQKVNRFLKAQTHVKQKLKEINKSETDIIKDGSLLLTSNSILSDQEVNKPYTINKGISLATDLHDVLTNFQKKKADNFLHLDSHSVLAENNVSKPITEDEDHSLLSDCSSVLTYNEENKPQIYSENQALLSVEKTENATKQNLIVKTDNEENLSQNNLKKTYNGNQTLSKTVNLHCYSRSIAEKIQSDYDFEKCDEAGKKNQAGVGNAIHIEDIEKEKSGDSEETPILIVDSQPPCSNASSLSSDDSQNSELGTKRRLSLKRKGKANRLSGVIKRQKVTRDVTLEDNISTREINVIQHENLVSGTNLEKTVAGSVENSNSDSPSILQQNNYQINKGEDALQFNGKSFDVGISKEQNNQCAENLDKYNTCTPVFIGSTCRQNEGSHLFDNMSNELAPRRRGRPPKCTKQITPVDKSETTDASKIDLKFIDKMNNVPYIEPSQDIVIECTPESTADVDLNKGFICNREGKEVTCTQNETDEANSDVMPHTGGNPVSSSQETLFESTQENSQPRRRGRPSKIKRKSSLMKSVLKISPVTEERKVQIKDTDKQEELNDRSHICVKTDKTNINFVDDLTIECTPDMNHGLENNTPQRSVEKLPELKQDKCISKDKDLTRLESYKDGAQIIHNKLLVSSQESTSSGMSISSDTSKPKRKRGRPPKHKPSNIVDIVKIKGEVNIGNDSVVVQENKNTDSVIDFSQDTDEITIPESQELNGKCGDIRLSHNHKTDQGQSCLSQLSQSEAEKPLEDLKDSQNSNSKNAVHESPELSTLKLIQESFVEKKEYSTRRRSSTGSPFMISSIFQFIIDESKRRKEKEDFDLPYQKFGKLLEEKTESQNIGDNKDMSVSVDKQMQPNKGLENIEICSVDVNKSGVNKIEESFAAKEEDVELDDNTCSQTRQQILECNSKMLNSEISYVNEISETNEHNNNVTCEKDSNEYNTKLTSSQSLFTPNPKEEYRLLMNEIEESQTDSMESLCENIDGQNLSSLELPVGDNLLVDICTCSLMFRRKEVPVIGCLSTKSLSLWRYHNGFSNLYKWDFLQNQMTERVSSFSVEGKAFFITLIKTQDGQFDVYISYYNNKRDNCIYTVTSLQTDFVEACHINNHVIAACFNNGETIQVKKMVLHQNWKSLLIDDKLEVADGYPQSLHTIDNLPDAVCVWTKNAEFCLWNHENKKLLLKIRLDNLKILPQLVGAAWEQGYFFLQFFFDTPNKRAGVQAILNPLTKRFCTTSEYKIKEWKGCKKHATSDDTIVTLDDDSNLCVWDRYTAELLSMSNQGHAKCVSIVTRGDDSVSGHIVTGGDNCIHMH